MVDGKPLSVDCVHWTLEATTTVCFVITCIDNSELRNALGRKEESIQVCVPVFR